MDLKFSLQPGCTSLPAIEVTLYRALKNKSKSASPSTSTTEPNNQAKSKTGSNEFPKSINAVPVCGPLELGSHLDLSGQGGNVVMTSPTLVLTKGRNFFLHIRAKSLAKGDSPEQNNQKDNGKETKSENVKATTSASTLAFMMAKVNLVFLKRP